MGQANGMAEALHIQLNNEQIAEYVRLRLDLKLGMSDQAALARALATTMDTEGYSHLLAFFDHSVVDLPHFLRVITPTPV